jgi:hypothetical protein
MSSGPMGTEEPTWDMGRGHRSGMPVNWGQAVMTRGALADCLDSRWRRRLLPVRGWFPVRHGISGHVLYNRNGYGREGLGVWDARQW